MKSLLSISLLFICFIGFGQDESAVEVPKILLKVPIGETVKIEDVTIKFVEVLEDSRCPEGVTCAWAGRAKLLVEIYKKGHPKEEKELLFGQSMGEENIDNIIVDRENYQIVGMSVDPYPTAKLGIDKEAYTLLVCKEIL